AGNSYTHLVFITATLLAGKILCPMNPNEGAARLLKKISSLGEPVLSFCENPHLEAELNARVMKIGREEDEAAPVDYPETQPAALIFTSGSSGESKIVEWSARGLISNIEALIEHH